MEQRHGHGALELPTPPAQKLICTRSEFFAPALNSTLRDPSLPPKSTAVMAARRYTSSPTRSRSGPACWRLSLTPGFRLRGEAKLAQPRRFRRLHDSLPLALLEQLRVAPFGREPVLLRFPSTIELDRLAVFSWH
jgi:hypothetical protein